MQALSAPTDKWSLVYTIMVLEGCGMLIPWNMFITAKNYFVDFKLSENYTGESTHYGTYFLNSVGIAAQIPLVLFSWINIFCGVAGTPSQRIGISIIVELIIFIVTVLLTMIDSHSWPGTFFFVTMFSIVILNVCNGIYQNTFFGVGAILPMQYSGGIVLGTFLCGVFITIVSMLSMEFLTSARTAAAYYFITAILFLLICVNAYFALPLTKFFRYYFLINEKSKGGQSGERPPFKAIFKKASPQLVNVLLIYVVAFVLFPAVHSDIKPDESDEGFFIPERHFVNITCFLTYNLFGLFGCLTAIKIHSPSPDKLIYPALIRIIFLPLFFFCNYYPLKITRTAPVFITNNWIYWLIAILMSYTTGYYGSLAMMYTPQSVDPQYAGIAGMFGAAVLVTGIFVGVMLSFIFPILVQM